MRPLIDQVVQDLAAPDDALLDEARKAAAPHGSFVERIPALHAMEGRSPATSLDWPGRLRVAAFNTERLKHPSAVRRVLDVEGIHVALLSEVDVGMARSGNTHTVRELTKSSGEGYLYGVEFIELDLGDKREMREHAGERNARSFHGNAIVTALEFEEAHLIPLEENGLWFRGREGGQRRVGGRIAVAARAARSPRPLWIVSVHLESKTDPADRRAQIQNLLRALDTLAPGQACIIGGDFNTKALPRGEDERPLLLDCPERWEPLFADLRSAGFEWAHANLDHPTQRAGPGKKPQPPLGKLDWIVVRGLKVENPRVVPAVDEQGHPISDHEMIAVDLVL